MARPRPVQDGLSQFAATTGRTSGARLHARKDRRHFNTSGKPDHLVWRDWRTHRMLGRQRSELNYLVSCRSTSFRGFLMLSTVFLLGDIFKRTLALGTAGPGSFRFLSSATWTFDYPAVRTSHLRFFWPGAPPSGRTSANHSRQNQKLN